MGQAFVLAVELPANVVHLHAHFLHTPASVTRYAALLRGLPWSCSAHAKDIWITPEWEKREKLDACAWVTTCTDVNAQHLRELAQPGRAVDLNYHGVDTQRFPPPTTARDAGDGTDPERPVQILAVGRAVDKKGFDDLLCALARLAPDRHWRLTHLGGGPMLPKLKHMARRLGIAGRVEWRGPQAHAAVLDAYRAADIFALPCRLGADGDRDGLPNVLLEAQSQKIPCVSTRISGIPELIRHDVTGPPGRAARDRRARGSALAAHRRSRHAPSAGRRWLRARRRRLLARGGRRPTRGPLRGARRADMRVAFYAPMKPPDHPVPSGDRAMAQALLGALRTAGHDAFVASRFRSFDGRGDATRQTRLEAIGHRWSARLLRRLRHPAARPDLWFTYHLHHKAPDWLGPAVSHALDIPYVVAEASVAAKQRDGAWAAGYAASVAAIETAAATIFLNPADLAGIRGLRGPARADERLPPFLDLATMTDPASTAVAGAFDRGARLRLITVAMMRPGAKLASYRLLAEALARVAVPDWELIVVGDGTSRRDVEAAFARFGPERIRLVGVQEAPQVAAWLRASDLFVWPAIDEAFGIALIEAQACGLPVVAGDSGGVGAVVAAGRTGVLVPAGDAGAFAAAISRLMSDTKLRRRMAAEAASYAKSEHDLPAAAARLDAVLRRVTHEHSRRVPAVPAAAR